MMKSLSAVVSLSVLMAACSPSTTQSEPEPPTQPASPKPKAPPKDDASDGDVDPNGGDPLVGLDGLTLPRKVDPLDPSQSGLDGPHDSPDDYIAKMAGEPSEGCKKNEKKPSVKRKSLAGRDDIEELMLMRVPSGDSCTPTEDCLMAIRTDKGWWIGERQCTGPVAGDREMSTSDTSLKWVPLKAGPAALVEYTVSFNDSKSRKRVDELRWLRLCGLDDAARPNCTRPVLLSCREADGSVSASTYRIVDGAVVIESKAKAGEACGGHEAFLVGTFPITFQQQQ